MFVIEKVEREREREREQGGPLSSYSCRQGGTDRLAMTLINISLTALHNTADTFISCYYITTTTTITTNITTKEDISDPCFISSL